MVCCEEGMEGELSDDRYEHTDAVARLESLGPKKSPDWRVLGP